MGLAAGETGEAEAASGGTTTGAGAEALALAVVAGGVVAWAAKGIEGAGGTVGAVLGGRNASETSPANATPDIHVEPLPSDLSTVVMLAMPTCRPITVHTLCAFPAPIVCHQRGENGICILAQRYEAALAATGANRVTALHTDVFDSDHRRLLRCEASAVIKCSSRAVHGNSRLAR